MSRCLQSSGPAPLTWTSFALRAAVPLLLSTVGCASEFVTMTVLQNKAYEADPINAYGEIQISRSVATSTPLTVFFSYALTKPPFQPAAYTIPTLAALPAPTDIAAHDPAQAWDFSLVYADQRGAAHGYRNPVTGVPATSNQPLYSVIPQIKSGYLYYTHQNLAPLANGDFLSPGSRSAITIPANDTSVRIRIVPYQDNDQLTGELEEGLQFRLESDNNSGLTYVQSDSQYRQVDIIDANITGQIVTLHDSTETTPPASGPVTVTPDGVIRVWFNNSSVRGGLDSAGNPLPLHSFSPYSFVTDDRINGLVARKVELTLGGTATLGSDYDMFWHIGGTAYQNGLALPPPESVSQPFAYRRVSETGLDSLVGTIPVAGAASFAKIAISPALSLPAQYFNLRLVTNLGQGALTGAITPNYGGLFVTPTPTNKDGDLITGVQQQGTRTIITLQTPIPSDIKQGATLQIQWDTVTYVAAVAASAGPPATAAVPEHYIENPVTKANGAINENTVYPLGTVAVSVFSNAAAPLQVGDTFHFSNDETHFYRITGPTPSPSTASPVNHDQNIFAVTSSGASNLALSFVTFWPPLLTPITQDGGGASLITENTATFDTNNRIAINIPALPDHSTVNPHLVYTYFDPAGTATFLKYPDGTYGDDDLPTGDWIEFRIAKTDDFTVEGAETVTLTMQPTGATNGYTVLNPGVATSVIADNDSLASVSNARDAAEPSVDGIFRVTFSKPFPIDIQVPYSLLSAGTTSPANWDVATPSNVAGDPVDFTMDGLDTTTGNGVVTLHAGQTSIDILVHPIADGIFEPQENISFQLLPSEDYILASATGSSSGASAANMHIIDTIGTVVVSGPTPNVAYEGDDFVTFPAKKPTWTITLNRRPDAVYDVPVTVNYVWSGTTVKSVDFTTTLSNGTETGLNGSVIFPAGNSVQTVKITPNNDGIVEGDETAILTVVTGNSYILGSNLTGTATIRDGVSPASVGVVTLLGPSPSSVYEKDTDSTHYPVFTLSLARTAGFETQPVSVSYQYSGAATYNTDYGTILSAGGSETGTQGTVIFGSNETVKTVTIVPIDDGVAESDEDVTMTLIQGDGYTLGTSITSSATIKDGTPPPPVGKVTIETSTPQYIYEVPLTPGATRTYTVKLSRYTGFGSTPVTVTLRITGNATAGTDYALSGDPGITFPANAVSILFGAGETTKVITLTPIADAISEGDELAILTVNSDQRYDLGTVVTGSIVIKDGTEPTTPPATGVAPGSADSNSGCGAGSGIALTLLGLGLGLTRLRRQRRDAA